MVEEHLNLCFVGFIVHVHMLKDKDPKEIFQSTLYKVMLINPFLSETYLNHLFSRCDPIAYKIRP